MSFKQKNDVNIFSDSRVEAGLGRVTPAGHLCSSSAKRHDLWQWEEEERTNSVNTSEMDWSVSEMD